MKPMRQEKWNKYTKVHHPPALIRSEGEDHRRNEITRALKTHLPEHWNRKGKVLALGCGDGFEIDILKSMGFENIVGITNDERELGPDIVMGDMHDMVVFGDREFDYIYSKEVLEHTQAPFLLLCELNRVLKPDGEYLHMISTSLEKQRDIYHFSCFPDWVWVDLFYKSNQPVKRILEHQIQLGFEGRKTDEIDFDTPPGKYSYDLNGVINGCQRVILNLSTAPLQ